MNTASDFNPSVLAEEVETPLGKAVFYRVDKIGELGLGDYWKLPYSIRVLVENVIRNYDGYIVTDDVVKAVSEWAPHAGKREMPLFPARVIMQDFTGVPAVVDLAAMRDAMKELGGDPKKVNPIIPVDLVIDHSVQVDYFGTAYALQMNMKREYERNWERYTLLKWAQRAFKNFRIVPPGKGIIHQVNIEYLAKVVMLRNHKGKPTAFPDSVLGTDSHTTMVNGLGVLGWGVGGIEAEAVILGQPYYMLIPEVVGVRLVGELPEGTTPTDLVLYITEKLRKKGVVGKFVEYFGPALKKLSVPDRATIANMAPEYGATMGFFPIDEATIEFLKLTGRDPAHVKLVEQYAKTVGLWYSDDAEEPKYTEVVEIDLNDVEPSISGPSHPEDRIPLRSAKERVLEIINEYLKKKGRSRASVVVEVAGEKGEMTDGSVVIAAITSCTNTSNPTVMLMAGLLAKKAVERGLKPKPWVKTSNAPGSRVVVEYWKKLGLLPYLEAIRYHITGFGCTVCVGNSGPLPAPVEEAIKKYDLYAATVLSGNRNFSGRIHPLAQGNFLASPPLVIAYALAGRIDIDFYNEPIGYDPNGEPVYLKDIWPTMKEVREALEKALDPELFKKRYADIFEGDENWNKLPVIDSDTYPWDPNSTYIRKPPFFEGMKLEPEPPRDIIGARVLVMAPDRISTDHISPAGRISPDSLAGRYLIERGVSPKDLNTCGSRRGNHEVMMRCTFDNPKFRNLLVPDREGAWTIYWPTGEVMHIFEAAMRYKEQGIPLIIIGGKNYGVGSSRDWAAKGPYLLGVKAVIAESFERIHRSNLVGMGILPLEFMPGENAKTLGLDGSEVYDILGISEGLYPGKILTVRAKKSDGRVIEFKVKARLDTPIEVEYYKHGGILRYVLRKLVKGELKIQ
ncbi:MAG: aconitate hydratase AcnA [Desulfurococcales archaeon]|nr:aconitate hydratase AcnA [Desulfurococcales archaeon]